MQAGNATAAAPGAAECPICMTELDPAHSIRLGCPHAHEFCGDCIATEVKFKVEEGGRPRCPCCPTAATYLISSAEVARIIAGATKRAGGSVADSTDALMQFAGVLQKMERNLLRQGAPQPLRQCQSPHPPPPHTQAHDARGV